MTGIITAVLSQISNKGITYHCLGNNQCAHNCYLENVKLTKNRLAHKASDQQRAKYHAALIEKSGQEIPEHSMLNPFLNGWQGSFGRLWGQAIYDF